MVSVVGITFQKVGHIYYFAPQKNTTYTTGEAVIVETQQSRQLGYVTVEKKEMKEDDIVGELRPILNKATEKELAQYEQNKKDARSALDIAKKKIQEHQLEMKLTEVEYTLDRSKLIFCFTSDGRVDFRELVKDLAAVFKTRIELRQVGVRDEAKILGGIGPCGRPICCSTFLGDFAPVSIKMAKDQGLSLNPVKISGLCGRLMCCLQYENDHYEEAKRKMPDYGQLVTTPDGEGKVVGLNLLSQVVRVKLPDKVAPISYDNEELLTAKGERNG